MIRPVLVVSLLAVSCPAVAQVKVFELGALRSDVLTEFGTPEKQEDTVDMFMRESPTNAYAVHVMYHLDSRQSRLWPKQRVRSINFIVDKPNNHRETLADLPEAKAICKGGCSLYGLKPLGYLSEEERRARGFELVYRVLAYPINPSAELLSIGDQVEGGFKPSSLRESNTTTTYGIGIHLKLERQTWDRSPPNWNSQISEVQISPVNLQFELELSRFDKLGTWWSFSEPSRRDK